jgi:hypothetical protein
VNDGLITKDFIGSDAETNANLEAIFEKKEKEVMN